MLKRQQSQISSTCTSFNSTLTINIIYSTRYCCQHLTSQPGKLVIMLGCLSENTCAQKTTISCTCFNKLIQRYYKYHTFNYYHTHHIFNYYHKHHRSTITINIYSTITINIYSTITIILGNLIISGGNGNFQDKQKCPFIYIFLEINIFNL